MSEEIPDAVVDDLFTCEVCGRIDPQTVRYCCYRPGRQRLDNSCYVAGRGDHHWHVGT